MSDLRAVVDAMFRDVRYALRGFARAPLVAFTVVSTVALGLGLVTVAFTLLDTALFRVDQVPNVHEIFAVVRSPTAEGERAGFTRAQFDALRRETNVFTDASAEVSGLDSRVDGRTVSATLVTGNFFEVLGVKAATGRTLTPVDDEPAAEQPVMVLSDRGWDRLFARDPAILGARSSSMARRSTSSVSCRRDFAGCPSFHLTTGRRSRRSVTCIRSIGAARRRSASASSGG